MFRNGVVTGVLIAESIRVGTEVEVPGFTVTKVRRVEVDDPDPVWTLLSFEAPEESAAELAEAFSAMLRADGGWYADFGSPSRHWVIFHGKVLSHVPGDQQGRAKIEAYGRSLGVPPEQLDWKDAASAGE